MDACSIGHPSHCNGDNRNARELDGGEGMRILHTCHVRDRGIGRERDGQRPRGREAERVRLVGEV